MMHRRLSVDLLGILIWVMSLHSGTFTSSVSAQLFTDFEKPAFFYPNAAVEVQPQFKLKISEKDLNRSVTFAAGIVNRMQRLEMNLGWSNIHIQPGSPSHGQLIYSKPEVEALRQGRNALIAAKATMHLMNIHCSKLNVNPQDCAKHISKYTFYSTPLHSSCLNVQNVCTGQELISKYRSLDGACNNKINGLHGKSFTGYKRLLPAHYIDGVQEPRRSVNRKFGLPSPRLISTSVCHHRDIVDNELTLAVMQWSQFIEHDLAHTATSKMVHSDNTIECCDPQGIHLSPRYVHPFCAPISVPHNDVFYSKYGVDCMPYVRSIAAMKSDCSVGPIDQINQATHFLDGSQIYGSDIKKTLALRKFHGGLLHISKNANKPFLPISSNPIDHCQYNNPRSKCYVSGDSRVNLHPHLTAMHTLWHREHNRIAVALSTLNPQWDDEMLYQEARKIVIAEMQHITYNEWLPVVLGKKYISKIYLSNDYSEEVDPSVSNSFANAALRFINSLMDGKISLYLEDRHINMSLHLQEHFNKPHTIEEPGHLDALVRGLATQHSQRLDMDYVQDITSQLYKSGEYGLDILSLDIQRGRDHGLPTYTAARSLCGLPPVSDFSDLSDVMTLQKIEALMDVYRHPNDIDLLVGGMSETPDDDSLLGPTFSCIIAEQLLRTRRGDRYFYDNSNQPKPFSRAQLMEIEKVTLARIFCDNGDDIEAMQPDVFRHISETNRLVSCLSEDIPFMNLKLWSASYL